MKQKPYTVLVQYSVQSRKGGTFLSKPKTESSVRVVKLPEDALEAVKIYMDHLKRKEGLLFRTSTGGLIHPGNVVMAFKNETQKQGFQEYVSMIFGIHLSHFWLPQVSIQRSYRSVWTTRFFQRLWMFISIYFLQCRMKLRKS